MSLLSIANQTTAVPNMFTIPVNFDPQTSAVAGLQFDFVIPAGTTFQSITLGPVAAAASKQISIATVGNSERAIIFGLNQTSILKGIIATINLVATAAGSPALHLQNAAASDPNGVTVPLSTVDGVLTINPIGGIVATTLAQLQQDLGTAQTALNGANTAMTAVQGEVTLLIPLANPDVTAQDAAVQALTSGLTTLTSTLNSIVAAIKPVTGQ